MNASRLSVVLMVLSFNCSPLLAEQPPPDPQSSRTNMEFLVLDDMEDVSDWYNGSPDETEISASAQHARVGQHSLCFANLVDYTKGEKNYPVGWPRTGKDMKQDLPTDWSEWDSFECWIYATTSRQKLPKTPVGIGFYHSGHKRSTHVRLDQVEKDRWVRVVVPTDDLLDASDVQRMQFNISESDYKHGDRVNFYIDQAQLTRYIAPFVAELNPDRKLLLSTDRNLLLRYKLAGRQGLSEASLEASFGQGDQTLSVASCPARREGEALLRFDRPMPEGECWVRLVLRDAAGRAIDRKQVPIRVIAGPFEQEIDQ